MMYYGDMHLPFDAMDMSLKRISKFIGIMDEIRFQREQELAKMKNNRR